jgi:hypothetical protein
VSGVWRLWPEHGGVSPQVQGDPVKPATGANSEHVFALHPLTAVDGHDVRDTLKPITRVHLQEGRLQNRTTGRPHPTRSTGLEFVV